MKAEKGGTTFSRLRGEKSDHLSSNSDIKAKKLFKVSNLVSEASKS